MDHKRAGAYWNSNADAWTQLARAGYDVYRDKFNTPAFFELLPAVAGFTGLDIGCGEGHNTRLLAAQGARVIGMDVSPKFVMHANAADSAEGPGGTAAPMDASAAARTDATAAAPTPIDYLAASAVELPFAGESFDFAIGTMSFMEMPETERVVSETFRVLKAGGFVQISIEHPCFATPHRKNLRDLRGQTYAIEVGKYFTQPQGVLETWIFQSAPPEVKAGLRPFQIPKFARTLSSWLETFLQAGFRLEAIREPYPSDDVVAACPVIQDAQVVSYFLHMRWRKP